MTRKTHVYSFAAVMATVNGLAVSGYFEGDNAIEITPHTDSATPMVGADGESTVSYSAHRAVNIVLRLQPDSPMNRILQNQLERAQAGISGGFPMAVRNTGNGEGGATAEAHVVQFAPRSYGANATAREWTIFAGDWAWTSIDYQRP